MHTRDTSIPIPSNCPFPFQRELSFDFVISSSVSIKKYQIRIEISDSVGGWKKDDEMEKEKERKLTEAAVVDMVLSAGPVSPRGICEPRDELRLGRVVIFSNYPSRTTFGGGRQNESTSISTRSSGYIVTNGRLRKERE